MPAFLFRHRLRVQKFVTSLYISQGKERLADARRVQLAQGSKSDHVMLANAYQGWERACSRGTSYQYCHENFLSQATLKVGYLSQLG